MNNQKHRRNYEAEEPAGRLLYTSISLGQLVLILSFLFLVITLVVVISISVFVRDRAITDLAQDDAKKTSRLIFQSLYSAMRKGWTKSEIQQIITRLNEVEPDMEVHVFRGNPVIRQYGDIPGEDEKRKSSPLIQEALRNGKDRLLPGENTIRYIYPIKVKRECQQCHLAEIGEINGVIDIQYPIGNLKVSMNLVMQIVISYFVVMMLILFVALYYKLKFFIVRPVIHLVEVMQEIILHTDLSRRVQNRTRILELDRLTDYFNRLLNTLHSYHVKLEELSVRDPLTGTYNRRKFEQLLDYEIDRSRRHNHSFSMIMLDLDNFKHVNDTYGHPIGDLALKELAGMLFGKKRKSDILARLGGDEFAMILPETNLQEGLVLAKELLQMLNENSIELPTGQTRIHASIGVVAFPENGEDTERMAIAMDVAMYKAKRAGKNQISIIEDDDSNIMMEVFQQGQYLQRALEEDRVTAFFQPIVNTKTGEIFAYEVLARIIDGDTIIPAGEFIEVAEELGYSEKLDRRIMEKGLECRKQSDPDEKALLFFNLSSRSFGNEEKMKMLPNLIKEIGAKPEEVVLEITEREALPHIAELSPLIDYLHEAGIRIALDDFGSGFSSFMYLKYLPVDFLKLEGSFIKHMTEDERDLILVRNMHRMAKEFGLQTIAEYVEDDQVHQLLREIGVDFSQGYHFGMPEDCSSRNRAGHGK